MNKKLIILFIAIGVIVIGGIIGIYIYTNNPEYVMKKYVGLINDGKFDKLKKYEYNYEEYRIANSIDTYIDEGFSIEKIQDKAYISEYKFYEESDNIDDINRWTYGLYMGLMNFNVGKNFENISYIIAYQIEPGFNSLDQKYGGFNNVVLGKAHGRWKVVYSQYYYLK